jgi:hypothetical protein
MGSVLAIQFVPSASSDLTLAVAAKLVVESWRRRRSLSDLFPKVAPPHSSSEVSFEHHAKLRGAGVPARHVGERSEPSAHQS